MGLKSGPLILYVGKDLGYTETLESRYEQVLGAEVDFKIFPECVNAEAVSKSFLRILELRPAIIYIDLATRFEDHIRLALLLRRDNSSKQIPLVALVDESENLQLARASQADFVHIKCGEFHDVVYDPCYLAFPGRLQAPHFARARASLEVMLIEDFRVGYLTKDYLHLEGNLRLNVGEKIVLESNIPTHILPSKIFVVREVSTRNLYYDYRFGVDLNYMYVDPPVFEEAQEVGADLGERAAKVAAEAQNTKRQKQLEFESSLKRTIKNLAAWIEDNRDRSAPKDTKILIVDPNLDLLKDNKERLDTYPYTIRLQTLLSEELDELERMLPDILAFQFFDDASLEELEGRKERMDLLEYESAYAELSEELENKAIARLSNVFKKINSLEAYSPIVIIFGCAHYSSKAFQETFKYPLIMTHKSDFELKVVLDMANVYERKNKDKFERVTQAKIIELRNQDPIKNARLNISDFVERRYYIPKTSPLSYASHSKPITVESFTESEMSLLTADDLAPGVYRLEQPLPLSITLVPYPDGKLFESGGGKLKRYRALIHSVGEEGKRELRRFVNEVFGASKKEKEIKDLKAYKALNEKVALERESAREMQQLARAKEVAQVVGEKKDK